METFTLQVTRRLSITLGKLDRYAVISIYAAPSKAHPRPELPPGLTHEQAIAGVEDYQAAYKRYEDWAESDARMKQLGACRKAVFDFGDDALVKQAEDESKKLIELLEDYGIVSMNGKKEEDIESSALGYAIFNAMRHGDKESKELSRFLSWIEGTMGIVQEDAVEQEMKSEAPDV
jgi:hypothetical protein